MDTSHGDYQGMPSLKEIALMLEYQNKAFVRIEEQMKEVADLSKAVHLLTDQMHTNKDYMPNQERRMSTVTSQIAVHKMLLTLMGVCLSGFIPMMVTWNFQLRAELQELHSTSDTNSEKIRYLERATYKLPAEIKGK